ncbi:MAG: PEP-CTERM sorting domain-containing protein [Thermoguttaceae bacterium]
MLSRVSLFCVFVAAAAYAATANAELVLYSDSFTRSGALNGTTPDVAVGQYGASATATWVSSSYATGDGAAATIDASSAGNGRNMGLAFTPESGHVYTFSAAISCSYATNSGNWAAMGFSTYLDTGNYAYYDDQKMQPYGWALFRNVASSTTMNQSFTSGLNGGADIGMDSGTLQVQLVLDTTPSLWTETWIVNGVVQRGPVALGDSSNPTINYLSFGASDHTKATIDNVQLSVDAVPEPSTLALLACGVAGLLCYAWKKRS